jgi:hypothetical protein
VCVHVCVVVVVVQETSRREEKYRDLPIANCHGNASCYY